MPRISWKRRNEAAKARNQLIRDIARARLEDGARNLVGVLQRGRVVVHYINLRPLHQGRTLEGNPEFLVAYLIRNKYATPRPRRPDETLEAIQARIKAQYGTIG